MGAMDLGGKYKGWLMLTYRVFSIIPAIGIGIHILQVALFKKEDARLRVFSKIFAIIYIILFELAWIFFLFVRCP